MVKFKKSKPASRSRTLFYLHSLDYTLFKQIESIPFAEDKSERKGEYDYVSFIFDTFIGDNVEQVRKILQNINDPNLITEILEFLSIATEGNEEKGQITYKNHFPKLKEQFLNDLEMLSEHPNFLLDNIASLFVHYTFVAMSQIILHTNKVTDFDGNQFIPVYYILQWEKAARWRSSYKHGYGMMKGEIDGFFSHEHALNILALNTFTEERNLFYHDLEKILSEAGPEARNQFKQSIYAWLEEVYEAKTGIEVKRDSKDTTLESAFRDLAAAIREGVSKEINSRYQKSYEAIVSKFFRKNGGSLGTLLSLNQKQLLLLVAVSVRNDRIELKQLWKEFELRGVWLDHQSKEEVVQILDKLSYMEKKSDSGDAQYVQSIL